MQRSFPARSVLLRLLAVSLVGGSLIAPIPAQVPPPAKSTSPQATPSEAKTAEHPAQAAPPPPVKPSEQSTSASPAKTSPEPRTAPASTPKANAEIAGTGPGPSKPDTKKPVERTPEYAGTRHRERDRDAQASTRPTTRHKTPTVPVDLSPPAASSEAEDTPRGKENTIWSWVALALGGGVFLGGAVYFAASRRSSGTERQPAAYLDVHTPGHPARSVRLDLTLGRIPIGRGASAVVRLDDERVSTIHAALEMTPLGLRVTDLGSTNGVKLNGAPIRTAILSDLDQLQVGRTSLCVHISMATPR